MRDHVWAIVLAGGRGLRYGRLKQLDELAGSRLVDHTVAAARRTCDRVALVLPSGVGWDGEPVDALAVGGDHQSESLRAGLAVVPAEAGVLVLADPAHPLAADRIFTEVVEAVRAGADGAVPVVPLLEVVQRVRDGVVVDTLPSRTRWSRSRRRRSARTCCVPRTPTRPGRWRTPGCSPRSATAW